VYDLARRVTVQYLLKVDWDQKKAVQGRVMVFQDQEMVSRDRGMVYLGQVTAALDRTKDGIEECLVLKRM
jgi:hypothetical protein